MHEENFLKFFDTIEIKRIIKLMKETSYLESNGEFKKALGNLDEILINVPSIFVMLNRHTEAE